MRGLILFFVLLTSTIASAQEAITGFKGLPPYPQYPGFHKLVYHYTDDGKPYEMSFLLYLPQDYSAAATRPTTSPSTRPAAPFPLLTFMSGLGERGTDPQMMFASGVPQSLFQAPDVLKWMPMIMLGPQCPADHRYEEDRIGKAIASLMDEISKRYPVDPQRRYLTGFSLGGTGCWSVARFAPDKFAVIAPVVARAFQPQLLADKLAGTQTTCLVISGELDAKSEPGSGEMVTALHARGVDVVQARVLKGDHFLWPWYYRDKRFYEWLLQHRLGQPKPADRMDAAAIVKMAEQRTIQNEQNIKRLEMDLRKIAPWWNIDNCALGGPASYGLQKQRYGKQDVYVTLPYFPEIPCRLFTTTTLPKADNVKLHLVVGRHPQGAWRLIVRVNEQEVLATPIDKTTAPDLWKELDIDLSKWSAQEVRLQLCQASISDPRFGQANWQSIQILPNQ